VVKNKVAPPFKQAEFDGMFGKGISRSGGILDLGVEGGFVTKTGTWFTYGEIRLGQGRENSKQFLEDNPVLMQEIEDKVRAAAADVMAEMLGTPGVTVGAAAPAANGANGKAALFEE
jgi:recombination protein RecA